MSAFSLRCFGVGDGLPCADRNHSSFLYRFGKVHLLVDCGESISSRYKASGLSYDAIDRIFISHLHSDHLGGFFMLVQGFWLEQRQKELPVHLPGDGIEAVRNLFTAACLFDQLLPFRLRFAPLRAGKAVLTGNVRMTPYLTSHLSSMREAFQNVVDLEFASFCFLFEAGRLRIGHSSDIGAPEDLTPLVKKPLDLLVCELAHATPEALFGFLQGRPIKKIVFVHLARRYWDNLPKIRAQASQMLGRIPCCFAQDGEEIGL